MTKVHIFSDVLFHAKDAKLERKTIVFVNGCFDLLHYGHIDFLQRASALGDILIVGVNSDASIKKLKGESRPIIPERARLLSLAALECVDYVFPFDELTPVAAIEKLKPDFAVKGSDYYCDRHLPEFQTVKDGGGTIVILDRHSWFSTGEIIDRVAKLSQI